MFRQSIITTENNYVLHLPDDLVGKRIEVIAFSEEEIIKSGSDIAQNPKRKIEVALDFYKNHSVDFNKLDKWTREDLYE